MTTARLAVLLGFTWSLATTTLALRRSVQETRLLPPTPSSDNPVHLAAEILRHTDRFASVAVGPAGITSTQVLAWRVVFQSPAADSVFRSLLSDGTRAGQLYALAALFINDHAAYLEGAARQRALGGDVATQFGCIGSQQPVAAILDEMDRGQWSAELLAGRLLPLKEFSALDRR
jgi:xanthine/CO dehydrogenase XdhC/CoxF family maturation factor